ncbi:MAG: hypothetical protein AB1428_01370 [Bacteroidota bacterium]
MQRTSDHRSGYPHRAREFTGSIRPRLEFLRERIGNRRNVRLSELRVYPVSWTKLFRISVRPYLPERWKRELSSRTKA